MPGQAIDTAEAVVLAALRCRFHRRRVYRRELRAVWIQEAIRRDLHRAMEEW